MFYPGILILVYGILVLLGGIMGYVKAKSRPSLIAGGASGLILAGCGLLLLQGNPVGAVVAAAVAVLLIVLFVVRLAGGAGRMPAVPIIVLSLVGLGTCVWVLLKALGTP